MNPAHCTCTKEQKTNITLVKSDLILKPDLSKSLPKKIGDPLNDGEVDNIEDEEHNMLKASFGNLPKSVL